MHIGVGRYGTRQEGRIDTLQGLIKERDQKIARDTQPTLPINQAWFVSDVVKRTRASRTTQTYSANHLSFAALFTHLGKHFAPAGG